MAATPPAKPPAQPAAAKSEPRFRPKLAAIPALSIRQPWASLIVHGLKSIENRNWATDHRGTIAVHASGTYRDMESPATGFYLKQLHPRVAALVEGEPDPRLVEQLRLYFVKNAKTMTEAEIQAKKDAWFDEHELSDEDLVGLNSYTMKRSKSKAWSPKSPFHFGAIIGTVDIVDCITPDAAAEIEIGLNANLDPACDIPPQEWIDRDSQWCWLLQNAVKFAEPIECRGKLKLFDLDAEIVEKVNAAREAAISP